jgi:hypothetical protein
MIATVKLSVTDVVDSRTERTATGVTDVVDSRTERTATGVLKSPSCSSKQQRLSVVDSN